MSKEMREIGEIKELGECEASWRGNSLISFISISAPNSNS
jgi:hypothetical protein